MGSQKRARIYKPNGKGGYRVPRSCSPIKDHISTPARLKCGDAMIKAQLIFALSDEGEPLLAGLGFPSLRRAAERKGEKVPGALLAAALPQSARLTTYSRAQKDKALKKQISCIERGQPVPLYLYGTSFQHSVWQAMLKIKSGETTSYGALAKTLSNSPRAVGGAVGANQIAFFMPCHRVLNKDKTKDNYRWGVRAKQILLKAEGL